MFFRSFIDESIMVKYSDGDGEEEEVKTQIAIESVGVGRIFFYAEVRRGFWIADEQYPYPVVELLRNSQNEVNELQR